MLGRRRRGDFMTRRDFLQMLAFGAASGIIPGSGWAAGASGTRDPYDAPKFGNVSLLHFTDCHAQLLPIYFREPDTNLGVGPQRGKLPHIVGERLLRYYRIKPRTPEAYAFSHVDFEHAARIYGKVGGFAHLKTLIRRYQAERPGCLLLDGGDTWQGSATAL